MSQMPTFQDMYESYAPEVYRFSYWLAGDVAVADDITSETFIRAWAHWGSIRTETLKAYLLQIARNAFLGWIRKQRTQISLEDGYVDPHPGPEQLAESHAELELVHRVLRLLPEVDRAAFLLRVQHDLPYAEIARMLRLSVTAVKVKVHRTRKKLLLARMRLEAE
jgi:RNA polymerase sigma-70 factor (ECF subfamily)